METPSLLRFAATLFIVLNATGQIPLFISILSPYDPKIQRKMIVRELFFALLILLAFAFFGDEILSLLGITKSIIGMAGGILLFLIALSMIFPKEEKEKGLPPHEPLIVPLAIPAIAGPGSIAAVMVFTSHYDSPVIPLFAIFLAWLPSLLILLAASYLQYFLGKKGLTALQRLGGMLVCLVGIQMFSKGVIDLVKENFFL